MYIAKCLGQLRCGHHLASTHASVVASATMSITSAMAVIAGIQLVVAICCCACAHLLARMVVQQQRLSELHDSAAQAIHATLVLIHQQQLPPSRPTAEVPMIDRGQLRGPYRPNGSL